MWPWNFSEKNRNEESSLAIQVPVGIMFSNMDTLHLFLTLEGSPAATHSSFCLFIAGPKASGHVLSRPQSGPSSRKGKEASKWTKREPCRPPAPSPTQPEPWLGFPACWSFHCRHRYRKEVETGWRRGWVPRIWRWNYGYIFLNRNISGTHFSWVLSCWVVYVMS